ncbi:MAG: (2Fe-2S) ferredoxin domain-containing protein [Clostridiaceae bacterium]|nr:(2Fe-2S) ferredoxin domain-containing protein [Clostridiaceae bacterium]
MKSLEELRAIKAAAQSRLGIRNDDAASVKIVVGMATCGIAAGARPVLNALTEEVAKRGLKNVAIGQTGCIGICQYEPVVEVYVGNEEKVTYVNMTPEKAVRIVNDHIVNGNVVIEYTIGAATK